MERPRRRFSVVRFRAVDLPAGLTHPPAPARGRARRLRGDGRPGGGRPRRGDDRGGRHRRRLEPSRRSTSPAPPSASSTATGWSAYGEVGHRRPLRRRRPPRLPRPGHRHRASRTGCRTTPAAKGIPEIGMPVPGGLARRPPARGARLPGPLEELGARAARRARPCRTRALPEGYAVREADPSEYEQCLDGPGGRVPRVVGPRARDRSTTGWPRSPGGPASSRGTCASWSTPPAPVVAMAWVQLGERSRRSSPGSPPRRTSAAAAWPRRCWSTRSRPAARTARSGPSCPPTRAPARSALYEKVGMVVTSTWVNRAIAL